MKFGSISSVPAATTGSADALGHRRDQRARIAGAVAPASPQALPTPLRDPARVRCGTPPRGRLRLLVAERAPTRLGIRMALNEMVEICAEVETAEHAIEAARRAQPDICIVGTEITADAAGAVRALCSAAPSAAVIVLVEEQVDEDLLEFVRAGAVGYVAGAVDAERLVRIVRAVAADEAVIPRSMVASLLVEVRGAGAGQTGLTLRESQVLRLVRRGQTTAEISEQLGIVPVTVRRHVSSLVRKLGLENRAALSASGDDRVRRRRASRPRSPSAVNVQPSSKPWARLAP